MTRAFYVLLATIIYVVFFATFLYLIGFVGGLPFLPTTVDHGLAAPWTLALPLDIALIALFGVQHSVMARPGFKARWTQIIPAPIERAIYVLAASVVLMVLFALWRPIAGTLWQVDAPAARTIIWAIFAAGWAIVLLSTFMLSHFELFGLTQTVLHLRNRAPAPAKFRIPFFYRLVRHPLYTGFLVAFWATPVMSCGHLLLAAGISVYILIAIRYEERDLVDTFGGEYEDYRGKVGMLAPRLRRGA